MIASLCDIFYFMAMVFYKCPGSISRALALHICICANVKHNDSKRELRFVVNLVPNPLKPLFKAYFLARL